MNINNYKQIDYSDNESHTATAAEHMASIIKELKELFTTNTDLTSYIEEAYNIQEAAATLNALAERNAGDIITVTFADWSGYIIKDEEEA